MVLIRISKKGRNWSTGARTLGISEILLVSKEFERNLCESENIISKKEHDYSKKKVPGSKTQCFLRSHTCHVYDALCIPSSLWFAHNIRLVAAIFKLPPSSRYKSCPKDSVLINLTRSIILDLIHFMNSKHLRPNWKFPLTSWTWTRRHSSPEKWVINSAELFRLVASFVL